jgi:hypothetical protein
MGDKDKEMVSKPFFEKSTYQNIQRKGRISTNE